MRAFRARTGGFVATFEPEEARMLTQFATQLTELLNDRELLVADPAVLRLFPDAYRGDAEAAAEFRRFTADELAERKAANAQTVIDSLREAGGARRATKVTLGAQQAQAWIRTITDLRLTAAARLGIDSEDVILAADRPLARVYDWLAFVQDSLVTALQRRL